MLLVDEESTITAVEGDRLNIKCNFSEAVKITKVHWTKELDEEIPLDWSKKSQWYDSVCVLI